MKVVRFCTDVIKFIVRTHHNTDYSEDIIEKRRFSENNPMGDLMPISVIRQDTPYSNDVGY